jgi:hypothetical protein
MIVSGALDLSPMKIEAFPLTEIGNALAAAAPVGFRLHASGVLQ